MSENELRTESGAADRLIFFSDAVVAIAITLLALDLPVPTGITVHELLSSVVDNADSYLAFLISFVVIAAMWSQHHHVFRYAERSDAWLRTLDLCWLMMVVLNPFATRLLTSEGPDTAGTHALRWGFYAVLQMLASVTFLAMVHHMISRDLQAPDTPPSLIGDAGWRNAGSLVGFGLSIPLFLLVRWAWVLWIAAPLLVGEIARRRRRHQRAAEEVIE
jgi:uncharacterized membrane protein